MTDLVLIAAMVAFIALCVAYVGWCDRIIGPDEPIKEIDTSDAAGVGSATPAPIDKGVHA